MSFTDVRCTYKNIFILTTCVFVFHRYVWAKNIQTLTSKVYTCVFLRYLQMFTGVSQMFTREKKTFISSSLCGRAEWRCLITARRQETGLCFAMKNTADDISLVVQRTIHNKIQIIADFAKTFQTRRWCWSFLAKLSKTQHILGGTYFGQLATFTSCRKTRFVCLFLTFYPYFLEARLPNWLPETWSKLLRKPTNVPGTQTVLRRSTVGQGLVMMLTMMMIKMTMIQTMMTMSDLRKAAGLAPWTRLIFMNAFNWPVPRT